MAAPGVAFGGWTQPVAAPLNIGTRTAAVPSMTTLGGAPVVAWTEDNGSANQVFVSQLASGFWNQLGGSLNINGGQAANSPSIATVGGLANVAWSEQDANTGIFQINVKGFSNGTWNSVGGPVNVDPTSSAFSPSLAGFGTAIIPSPWVAFVEYNGNGVTVVHVRSHGTLGWADVGGTIGDTTKNATSPKLVNIGGTAYVAWEEQNGVGQIHVDKLVSNTWTPVGGVLNANPAHTAGPPSIASIGGVPYVAWAEDDGAGTSYVRVVRLVGGARLAVGSPINLTPPFDADSPRLADVGGVPVVTWTQSGGPATQVEVARFSGDWAPVGPALNITPAQAASSSVLTSIGGVPYAAWQEAVIGSSNIRVARLEPDVLSENALASDTGALLTARVRDYGVALPVGFEYGPGATFGTSAPLQTTSGAGSDTLTQQISGLTPGTAYSWRAFGSDTVRQTSLGATQAFTTTAAPGSGPAGPSGADGSPGPAGSPGATGPRGPRGRDAKVTCKVKKSKGKTKVTCRVTFVKAKISRAALERGGRVYARGTLDARGGLVMRPVRRVRAGRYTLVLAWRGPRGAAVTERRPVTIR
jgi:hypothetical protein